MAENKLNDMISSTLEKLRAFADANTVIGEPLATDSGTVIIPVSKISIGFAGGGTDFFSKSAPDEKPANGTPRAPKQPSFGGGSGTGVTVVPVCFLAVKASGDVEILNVDNRVQMPTAVGIIDSVSSFIDRAPDLIARFKSVLEKNKPETGLDDEIIAAEAEAADTGDGK